MPIIGGFRLATSTRIAWAGAALFLLSLVWSAVAYLSLFDRRPPRLPLTAAIAVDLSLFTVFALHHSLLARSGAKRWVTRHLPPELERSAYTWAASLLLVAVCAWWQPVPGTLYVLHGPLRLVGYTVQLAGVVLTIRSSAALGVLDLAGVRQVQRAREGSLQRHAALETRGLYGFVRHPLYFAWALMVCGSPDMTATRATFAIVSTGYLALAIPWEERSLMQIFGSEYDTYRRTVRWRMIPGVY